MIFSTSTLQTDLSPGTGYPQIPLRSGVSRKWIATIRYAKC